MTKPEIVLDLSRLLSRVLHPTPTGVDRVEMAYARGLIAAVPERLRFAALHPAGLYGRLARADVVRFLDRTEHDWAERERPDAKTLRRRAMATLAALRPLRVPNGGPPRVYVQSSPHHLDKRERVAAIMGRERARFVCMVHDLIPIEFPEFARPGGAAQHRLRLETMVAHADGIVANSAATLACMAPHLQRSGRQVAARVALLGADGFVAKPRSLDPNERPYFLCLGTIEPRKNHLLLLNLWRRFAAEAEQAGPPPRLILVGRRGWENENVVDMLERCEGLQGNVLELGTVPDRQVIHLVRGASALLLPSFAEGYGMPVAEALASGTPVICSDLAALREAGGEVPEYLDPLDGLGWAEAIRAYADPAGSRRLAQLARMGNWTPPKWRDHVATVLDLVEEVAALS